jgi:uncharacterized repeat protein (TIGR03837 family)
LGKQKCSGVEVCLWRKDFADVQPADLVIEAFACQLPQNYLELMAKQQAQPAWINLEYLSAEDWVSSCHTLPSPHTTLSLTKYFFFPGFTQTTGGLLLEHNLLARRETFQNDVEQQCIFWQSLGMVMPENDTHSRFQLFLENALRKSSGAFVLAKSLVSKSVPAPRSRYSWYGRA